MRYDADWLLESLLLSIKSPKAYAHLRKENILPLPSPSVLRKMISAVSGSFGFNHFAIKELADYMRNRPLNERYCSLMWDEITISSEITFNKNTFQFEGFVDHNWGDTEFNPEDNRAEPQDDRLADHALVLIVRPYMINKIQTIGVFPAKGAVKGKDLFRIIMKALILLEEVGARVLSLVCDGAQTNVTVWNQFKVTGKTGEVVNKFAHPTQDETPVYCLRDVPHLLKSLRNHLFNHKNVQVLSIQI